MSEKRFDSAGRLMPAQRGVIAPFDEQPWAERGLCRETDPEAFFPEKGGSTREAKRTCRACEVREECLAWALDRGERYGIWGGLSERERRAIERKRATKSA